MNHEEPAKNNSANPDNPYNIDYARERRLRMWFIGLIGGAFLVAAALVLLAFLFDALAPETQPPVAPSVQPAQGVQTRGSYDGPAPVIS